MRCASRRPRARRIVPRRRTRRLSRVRAQQRVQASPAGGADEASAVHRPDVRRGARGRARAALGRRRRRRRAARASGCTTLTPRKSSDADLARPPRPPWVETPSPRPPRLPTVLSAVSRASKTISARATGPASPPGAAPLHHPRAPRRNRAERKPSPGKRRSRRRGERPRPRGGANRADHEWAAALEQARARGEARGGRIEAKGIEARVGSRVGVFPRRRPRRRARRRARTRRRR